MHCGDDDVNNLVMTDRRRGENKYEKQACRFKYFRCHG